MIAARLRFSSSGGSAAQRVVAAERDDQHPDVALERPVEPAQSAGRRVAGHAGVDHLVVQPGCVDLLLQQRWVRLARREAEARGQAVAENDDARTRSTQVPPQAPATRSGRRSSALGARVSLVAIGTREPQAAADRQRDASSVCDGERRTLDVPADGGAGAVADLC